MANPRLQVMDLSWDLSEGFYVSGGFGVYFPLGQWEQNALINIGANFWTFEPLFAFSYYKDGWTASLQAAYDTNTINPTNQYYSGNQVFLNGTFMKCSRASTSAQLPTTPSRLRPTPTTAPRHVWRNNRPPGELVGVGGTMSTLFGHLSVQFMITQEVYAINSVQGTKAWLNLIIGSTEAPTMTVRRRTL